MPRGNLLGPEKGQGFIQLMQKLQLERRAFGKPIIKFQNTRFKLVEMYTVGEICQTFRDGLLKEHQKGTDVVTETSMAK